MAKLRQTGGPSVAIPAGYIRDVKAKRAAGQNPMEIAQFLNTNAIHRPDRQGTPGGWSPEAVQALYVRIDAGEL